MEARDGVPRDWRTWRRFQALRLKQEGWYQRSIAVALATQPADMRCSFDRLAELAASVTGQDPLSGHLFLFRSRMRVTSWGQRSIGGHWCRPNRKGPPASTLVESDRESSPIGT
jgi:hypothetical protein